MSEDDPTAFFRGLATALAFSALLAIGVSRARAAEPGPAPTVSLTREELSAYVTFHQTMAVAQYATEQARKPAADALAKVAKAFPEAQSGVETAPASPEPNHVK